MSTQGAKLLSMILAGICGVLFLLAITLQLGVGRGYTWLPLDTEAAPPVGALAIDRTPFKLPGESEFAATQARPLFNEDRKPTPEEASDDTAKDAPPPVPLNISLTGVVLTPKIHLAMVQDKTKNNSVALKEGMPMPGDQGGWTLTTIKPRSAIFRDTTGEEIEVELSTAVANPTPGPANRQQKPTPGTPALPRPATNPLPPNQNPVAAAGPNQPNQQEVLQRRIEERRKQMREEAERMKQQQATPQQREEIQRMQQQLQQQQPSQQ